MTVVILFALLLLTIVMGIPVAFGIGIASLVTLFLMEDIPLSLVVTKMFSGLDSFSLMAIPLYVLAGELLNGGGLTERIVAFARSLVGHIRGGLAHVNVVASMMFGGVSGSTTADTAAVGSVLIPAMQKAGYDKDFSISVTVSSATIGAVIPPSILMVLYGSLTNVSIGKLFLGGLIPGILVGVLQMVTNQIICYVRDYKEKDVFKWKVVFTNGIKASGALLVPFIIIGGIAFGIMTPTEAGVAAVVVALFLGIFVYRRITSFQDLKRIFFDSAVSTSVVMIILSFSMIFSELLIRSRFQTEMTQFLTGITDSAMATFFIILLFIFILGLFVDTTPILVMFAVPLAAVAATLGLDPVHFGVVLVMTALIGSITPPVGVLLFLGCAIGGAKVGDVLKIHVFYILALVVTVVIVALIPQTVTWLPSVLMD